MPDAKSKIDAIYSLERLSAGNTVIHSLHPVSKLLGAVVFIATVISFDRYAFGRMIPFIFYPVIQMAVSETPYLLLLKRVLVALPFCLFAGASGLMLERGTAFSVGGVAVSYGAVAFFVILYRTFLCVMAVLILVAVTPFTDLTSALRRLKVPDIFVTMYEMTYRYIGVLFGEASSMYTAYSLRGARNRGVDIRHSGSFVGCLLLRSFDRAERIYAAMKCRGYALGGAVSRPKPFHAADMAYFALVCGCCVFFRVFDVSVWFAERIV